MDAALLVAARATAMAERDPAEALYLASMTLRKLMKEGVSVEDSRCVALLNFINCFRLNIVQKAKKRGEPPGKDKSRTPENLMSEERKQLESLIGLSDADPLPTTFNAVPRRETQHAPVNAAGYPKLLLRPKASQNYVVALLSKVLKDKNLALRIEEDSIIRHSGLTPKKKEKRARAILANRVARGDDVLYINRFFSTSVVLSFRDPTGAKRAAQERAAQENRASERVEVILPELSEARQSTYQHVRAVVREKFPIPILGVEEASKRFTVALKNAFDDFGDFAPNQLTAILAERERRIFRRIHKRKAVIADLPESLPEGVRREASLESRKLDLLNLQRKVRARVSCEMKKMISPITHEGYIPPDTLSRLCRNRSKPAFGILGIAVQDHGSTSSLLPSLTLEAASRAAQVDKQRMSDQKSAERRDFLRGLIAHERRFKTCFGDQEFARKQTNRLVMRHFQMKEQEEHRKKRQEQIRRLQALRANDNEAYLNLLKTTKNNRLLHLIKQTDGYMMRIGAQIERARDLSGEARSANPFASAISSKNESRKELDEIGQRREMYFALTHSITEEVQQPSILVGGVLKPYQLDGLKWLVSLYNNSLNGILADEMGLGKTIQTISLITYLLETKKNKGPFLVIVPLSTLGNWVRELNLWAPTVEKIVYRGNRIQRRSVQAEITKGTFNVLLTTYEYTTRDTGVLSPIQWQYIIIDEGHRIKNAKSKLAMTLGVKYKSRNRLLLTGTPLQNNLSELWALLNFLLPAIFSSADTFEKWFKEPFETSTLGEGAELDEEETLLIINRLHQVLRPFLLRRLKTDVESQLPDKVEHVIQCELSVWQIALYRQIRNKIAIAAGNSSGVRTFNNMLMQLKKICNHPYLFYDYHEIEMLQPELIIRSSGKFLLLEHMLKKLQLTGHRVLLFSQMTSVLDYLEDFLVLLQFKYLRLDGNTKSEERQTLLESFNATDSQHFCFLLSTRAGGLGLNLQSADTVIIFDSDWNPMMDLQAQDRAHRIGQTKEVRVFRLISANSVEVKILERASQKLRMDAQVIQAGQFNNRATESDRRTMLKQLLQSNPGSGGSNGENGSSEVPSLREVNEMLARDRDEFQTFEKFDRMRSKSKKNVKPMKPEELPPWVLEVETAPSPNSSAENLGRGQRRRSQVNYADRVSEGDWVKVMEGELSLEAAQERRRKRSECQNERRSSRRAGPTSLPGKNGDKWESLDDDEPLENDGVDLNEANGSGGRRRGSVSQDSEDRSSIVPSQSKPPKVSIRRSFRIKRSSANGASAEELAPRKRLRLRLPVKNGHLSDEPQKGETESETNGTDIDDITDKSFGRNSYPEKLKLRLKLPVRKEQGSGK